MSDLKALAYACGGIFDNRHNSAAVHADAYRKLLRAIELHDCDRNPDALTEQLKAALSRAVAAEAALAARNDRVRELEQTLQGLETTNYGQATALAAAQAQVKGLREALQLALEPMPYDPDTAQWSEPGDDELRKKYTAEWERRAAVLRAALAAPSDTTALRAFVMAMVSGLIPSDRAEVEEKVDTVLTKEGM